jgi:hypothetical protein
MHKPNDVVLARVAVRVLDRELRFADAAQAVNRLRLLCQRGNLPCRERGAQLREQFLAPGEMRIARKENVPNGGKR